MFDNQFIIHIYGSHGANMPNQQQPFQNGGNRMSEDVKKWLMMRGKSIKESGFGPTVEEDAEAIKVPRRLPIEPTYSEPFDGDSEFVFGDIELDVMKVHTQDGLERVPEVDEDYRMGIEESVLIASALKHNEPTWIWGPKGGGKTSAIQQMCALLRRPLYRINLQDGFDVSELVGKTEVVINDDGVASTEFVDGVLIRAMRNHGVLLIDEISAATPGVLLALQAVLEARGDQVAELVNNGNHGEVIQASPYFRVIVTDNTNGQGDETGSYGGTNVLNDAFLSRFSQWMYKGYPQRTDWVDLLHSKTTLAKRACGKIIKVALEINKGSAQLGAQTVTTNLAISPRETIDVARLYLRFGSMALAWKFALVNSMRPTDPDRVHFEDVLNGIIGE